MCFYKDVYCKYKTTVTQLLILLSLHNILLTLFVPTDRPRTILIVNAQEEKLVMCEMELELCGLDKLKASWKQYVFLRRSDS